MVLTFSHVKLMAWPLKPRGVGFSTRFWTLVLRIARTPPTFGILFSAFQNWHFGNKSSGIQVLENKVGQKLRLPIHPNGHFCRGSWSGCRPLCASPFHAGGLKRGPSWRLFWLQFWDRFLNSFWQKTGVLRLEPWFRRGQNWPFLVPKPAHSGPRNRLRRHFVYTVCHVSCRRRPGRVVTG